MSRDECTSSTTQDDGQKPVGGELVDRGLILCPLQFEVKQLRNTAQLRGWDVMCCGPGRRGVETWFRTHGARVSHATWLMLAGVAGAIDPAMTVGEAYCIESVIAANGERRTAPIRPTDSSMRARITSVDQVVRHRDKRAAIFQRTGAQLVDQESCAFASLAEESGVKWGIVRGVSDGVGTRLPRGLEQWVDEAGATRLGRVLASLLKHPSDLSRMVALGRASHCAMQSVADMLGPLSQSVSGLSQK